MSFRIGANATRRTISGSAQTNPTATMGTDVHLTARLMSHCPLSYNPPAGPDGLVRAQHSLDKESIPEFRARDRTVGRLPYRAGLERKNSKCPFAAANPPCPRPRATITPRRAQSSARSER
jgi:hypothetical protein